MPRTHINGIDVYYEVEGHGSPLLFLNGSGSRIDDVRPLVRQLAGYAEVAVADSRGMGRTASGPGDYTMADVAHDAVGLADHLGWNVFDLVGISFGGMVAQEVAVTWPERIRRLVLLCTSSGGSGGSSYPLQDLAGLDPEQRAAQSARLLDSRFTPEWLAAHPRDRALLDQINRSRARSAGADDGAQRQLRARAGHDVYDRLPRMTCPTFVGVGRFDGIAPPRNAAAIAERLPDAQLRAYEGGHLFIRQDPAALADIEAFLTDG